MTERAALALVVLAIFVMLWALPADAHDSHRVDVVSIYDGDTLTIRAHVWDYPPLDITSKLRLSGIDTPERRSKRECEYAAATRARHFVALWTAERATRLRVEVAGKDKYGRLLGDLVAGDERLTEALLGAGLAVEYDGGKRKAWRCE